MISRAHCAGKTLANKLTIQIEEKTTDMAKHVTIRLKYEEFSPANFVQISWATQVGDVAAKAAVRVSNEYL